MSCFQMEMTFSKIKYRQLTTPENWTSIDIDKTTTFPTIDLITSLSNDRCSMFLNRHVSIAIIDQSLNMYLPTPLYLSKV